MATVGLEVGPGTTVAAELAFVAFDLDEEEAARGGDEGVDFVDGAVVGDEREVGPAVVGVASGRAARRYSRASASQGKADSVTRFQRCGESGIWGLSDTLQYNAGW